MDWFLTLRTELLERNCGKISLTIYANMLVFGKDALLFLWRHTSPLCYVFNYLLPNDLIFVSNVYVFS